MALHIILNDDQNMVCWLMNDLNRAVLLNEYGAVQILPRFFDSASVIKSLICLDAINLCPKVCIGLKELDKTNNGWNVDLVFYLMKQFHIRFFFFFFLKWEQYVSLTCLTYIVPQYT